MRTMKYPLKKGMLIPCVLLGVATIALGLGGEVDCNLCSRCSGYAYES